MKFQDCPFDKVDLAYLDGGGLMGMLDFKYLDGGGVSLIDPENPSRS